MFISVDLPAPFSPRSACTSPLRRSKFTWSLASTPGNRLVIPRSSRRGASAIGAILLNRQGAARRPVAELPSARERRCPPRCPRRGGGAHAAVRHHGHGAAGDRAERGLLARRRQVLRPRAQNGRARLDLL